MNVTRKPEWLQKRINPAAHADMERLLDDLQLHTVCQEASCPNISECFRQHQATFLILGRICTRLCTFCNVAKEQPLAIDPGEPARLGEAIRRLGLFHVVITSPTRDDLADGGAGHFAAAVAAIREASAGTAIELLIPDFQGNPAALANVAQAAPDIIGHNVETVPRLYQIREGADYLRSLQVLTALHGFAPKLKIKSGLMVGLGETEEELIEVFQDLRRAGCSYLSIGQYLAPSRRHHPVRAFIEPEKFQWYREKALAFGFAHVESGPYVRSSYHAAQYGA